MLLREIFNEVEEPLATGGSGLSKFLEKTEDRLSFSRSMFLSVTIHVALFILTFLVAKILVIILMFLGIDLGLFDRPKMKMRDIEFVFELPEKYDIKKSFMMKNSAGKSYSLAGPNPNNRP